MMRGGAGVLLGFAVLVLFSLAGDAASRALHLPVPGTVVGMLLLLAVLGPMRAVPDGLRRAAELLVAHLNLFYIPAAVAVTAYTSSLWRDRWAIAVAIVAGTWAALAVGALTSRAVASRVEGPRP